MKKKYLQLAVGIAISAFFIWFAFHLGQVDFGQLLEAVGKVNWLFGILMVVVTMVSFYWRAIRWKILVSPVKDVSALRLFWPMMVGFAFNNIMPARAGEVLRPLALRKQEDIPFGAGFSTVVVERLIDALTLLVLLVLLPYLVTLDPTVSRDLALGDNTITISAAWFQAQMPKLSIIAGILLVGIISFQITPIREVYLKILDAMPVIPAKIKEKLREFVIALAKGFESMKSPKAIVLVIIHSAVIWLMIAFSYQVMSWGFSEVNMTFRQGIGMVVVTCVVITIPSSPGFFGLFEFGGMVGLIMMGVVPDTPEGASQAVAYTLVAHFLQWIPTTVVGLLAAGKLSVSASEAEKAQELAEEAKEEAGKAAHES